MVPPVPADPDGELEAFWEGQEGDEGVEARGELGLGGGGGWEL